MRSADRAVAVALRGTHILVIRRRRDGRSYSVLPGGAVEPGETPRAAVLRELREETGRTGTIQRRLWTLHHDDRTAHYFLVRVALGPLVLDGPEAARQSPDNSYQPAWVALAELDAENLQPWQIRDALKSVSPSHA